jgi:hypothetical protein
MVRQVNVAVRDKISSQQYVALMRYGAIRRLVEARASTVGEARIELPAWVAEVAVEEGRKLAAATVESGARVVGSLDSLTAVPAGDGADRAPSSVESVPLQAAVEAIVGVIGGATGRSWSLEKSPGKLRPAKPGKAALNLDKVPTRTLVDTVKVRAKAAVRRRMRSILHR